MSQQKRFKSCGLSTVQPDEGILHEFSRETLVPIEERLERGILPMDTSINAALDAIFRHRLDKPLEQYGIFHFRPETGFVEEDGTAKYEIFQQSVRQCGGFEYVYIIVDCVLPREDEDGDIIIGSYRLRGVSVPMPIAMPEYNWCNASYNWKWWSKLPADFNVGASVIH
jgi:hypothetical protein